MTVRKELSAGLSTKKGPRTIVFAVSGIIELQKPLKTQQMEM